MTVKRFAAFQRRALETPIEVKNHRQTTGYYISPRDIQTYQRLLSETRRAVTPAELPEHLRQAIAAARMDPEHDALNALLED